jgi:hypothetical protein
MLFPSSLNAEHCGDVALLPHIDREEGDLAVETRAHAVTVPPPTFDQALGALFRGPPPNVDTP